MILALDPGPTHTGFLIYDPEDRQVTDVDLPTNEQVLARLAHGIGCDALAIEMVESFGMAVGREVFETVYWIGRFVQAYGGDNATDVHRVYRKEVKMHLCGTARAKDPNVRQALLDRFGGKGAGGTKKNPGPLYGVSGHGWSALAVAVTFWDKHAPVILARGRGEEQKETTSGKA